MTAAMRDFLTGVDAANGLPNASPSVQEGEVDDIYFRVQGSGPPLVLLPAGRGPVPNGTRSSRPFTDRYCIITLTGPILGMVGSLEGRGRTPGYLSAVGSLIDAAQIQPGESVLEAGCGTGVLCRWVARDG